MTISEMLDRKQELEINCAAVLKKALGITVDVCATGVNAITITGAPQDARKAAQYLEKAHVLRIDSSMIFDDDRNVAYYYMRK